MVAGGSTVKEPNRNKTAKKNRQTSASTRKEEYDKLTPAQKVAKLIPGGSSKQRARLAKIDPNWAEALKSETEVEAAPKAKKKKPSAK
jgi:hypothetical protein